MAFRTRGRVGALGLKGERAVRLRVVDDLAFLHVERQVDQHRPRPPLAHDPEGLPENPRHHGGFLDAVGFLGDGLADLGDIHGLEGFAPKLRPHVLAGDGQDRDGVHLGGVKACHEIGCTGSGGGGAHADGVDRPGVAVGHVDGPFLVPGNHVLDLAVILHRLVKWQNPGPGYSENVADPLVVKDRNRRIRCSHLRHNRLLSLWV